MLFQFPGPSSLTQFLNSYLKTFAVFQNSDYLGCSFLPKRCFCKSKCWNVLFPCPPGHFWTRSAHLWTRKPTAVWPKWSLSFTCWRSSNAVSFFPNYSKACCCFFNYHFLRLCEDTELFASPSFTLQRAIVKQPWRKQPYPSSGI